MNSFTRCSWAVALLVALPLVASAQKPGAQKPDAQKPEAQKPEAQKPEAQKPEAQQPGAEQPAEKSERQRLFQQFEQTMSGAKLVGHFTVLGKPAEGNLPKEEYTIVSATKMADGDYWLLKSRIRYGDKDLTVPLPLEVKWAGDTPVITLTNLTIPGLGTFSSRVVIYNGKYAGTWTHGDVGGHLFGTVEKAEASDSQ